MHKVFCSVLFLCLVHVSGAQPSITSFSPQSAAPGTTVTISGNNFSSTEIDNIVFFGAVRAIVSNATFTTLEVIVPLGADYQSISVTTNARTAWSAKPFHPIFPGGARIRQSAVRNPVQIDEELSAIKNISKADFDGDGKVDILVWYPNVDKISVYRNTTTNHEISFTTTDITFDGGLQAIAADMDNDGKPDILLFNYSGVTWFRNITIGNTISFDAPVEIPLMSFFDTPIWIDWDHDGLGDIMCAGSTNIYVYRHLLNGITHSFDTPVLLPIEHSVNCISLGDVDNDGKTDALATIGNYSVICLRNSSTPGSISFTSYTLPSLSDPTSAKLVDVDNDGKLDVVSRAFMNDVFEIAISRNESTLGDVSFAEPVYNQTSIQTSDILPSDYNGDGRTDLVLVGNQSIIMENTTTTGSLQFTPVQLSAMNLAFRSTLIDFDQDGKPDIASIEEKFKVIRNQVGEPFIESFDPKTAPINTTVNILGQYLAGVTEVTIGEVPANPFVVLSDSEINAVVGQAINGSLRVVSPQGSYSLEGFAFIEVPVITSFSPLSGVAGQVVMITGLNFTYATGVSFAGIDAASFTILSDTQISAVIASGSSGTVTVVSPAGEAVSEDIFEYGFITGLELNEESKFQVYPNPVIGKSINVRLEGLSRVKPIDFELIAMTGKTVVLMERLQPSDKTISFMLPENLDKGLYILKLSSADEVLMRKVLVK